MTGCIPPSHSIMREPKSYTNNDGENPRWLMDWQDIRELKELRDALKVQVRNLNKQIKEAEQRNLKIDNDDL